jgi:hypothetical protein
MPYFQKKINASYYTTKGFYIFNIPVKVPYKKIYASAEAAGFKQIETLGPIIESSRIFGFGWIGVEVESATGPDIKQIKGDFTVIEHKGAYRNIGKTYKKISKEKPGSKEHYNLYIDNPDNVEEANLRTHILFR